VSYAKKSLQEDVQPKQRTLQPRASAENDTSSTVTGVLDTVEEVTDKNGPQAETPGNRIRVKNQHRQTAKDSYKYIGTIPNVVNPTRPILSLVAFRRTPRPSLMH
jgi:uncharacterized protein YoxC